MDPVTVQLFVADRLLHLLKIDVALILKKKIHPLIPPIEACELGISVFMLGETFEPEHLRGLKFPSL